MENYVYGNQYNSYQICNKKRLNKFEGKAAAPFTEYYEAKWKEYYDGLWR